MSGRRVLLVDDEARITRALSRELARDGYEVTCTSSPSEAMKLLETQPFDILISDQRMPGMTGTALMKLARGRYPAMLRVLMTGTPDLDSALEAVNEAEVHRFVTKPWSRTDLSATLCKGLEQLGVQREQARVGALVERWKASF